MRRCRLAAVLLACGVWAGPCLAGADVPPRHTAERGSLSRIGAAGTSPTLDEQSRLRERAQWLKEGESALSRLDVPGAQAAFDRAASITHSADTELGLVRTLMQAGAYRQALAFGAHTAGAHPDEPQGAVVYAWLLHLGGQEAAARRLIDDTHARTPGSPLIADVRSQLKSDRLLAKSDQLQAPARLAPYGQGAFLPAGARVVGSGVLLAPGRRAFVPLALVPPSGRVWVRNGLGQLARASVERRLAAQGVAVLRLSRALSGGEGVTEGVGDAFPGSIAHAVEFMPAANAEPAWPLLKSGFLGMPRSGAGTRDLGIALPPGPGGGPVFDSKGRWIGMANRANGGNHLVSSSRLREAAGPRLVAVAVHGALPTAPDQIYETALRSALQIIAAGRSDRRSRGVRTQINLAPGPADVPR